MSVVAEQYANLNVSLGNAQTTINQGGGIASGDTSVTVSGHAGFPGSAQYRIVIDNEIILVTGGAGTNTWTIQRGVEGTTAASHANGATVTHVLTAAGLIGVAGSILISGNFASQPAAGVTGRVQIPTDGMALYREDGNTWSPWGPLFPFVSPNNSLYSWVNQGSATIGTAGGTLFLEQVANGGASNNIAARVKSIPSAPYTVNMAFLPMMPQSNFIDCGMILRNSGSGDLITFGIAANTGLSSFVVIDVVKYTSPTSSGSVYTTSPSLILAPSWQAGPCMFFQIHDDNTNRTYGVSNDGVNFSTILSTSRTDFITPDQIGFYVNVNNATFNAGINILSMTGG